MRCTLPIAAALGLAALPVAAHAADPALQYADPAIIDPVRTGSMILRIYGENISSDNTGHPDWRQYYHIFMRKVGSDGATGPWVHCVWANGCTMNGWNPSTLVLQIDAGRWAHEEGATLQMRYYTGLDDADATDELPDARAHAMPIGAGARSVKPLALLDEAQEEEKEDSADRGDDETADPAAEAEADEAREPAAKQGPDDPYEQVGHQPMVPLHDLLGDEAGGDADDDPPDDTHALHDCALWLSPSHQMRSSFRGSAFRAWTCGAISDSGSP